VCVKVCGFAEDVAVEATSLDTFFPDREISLYWAPLIKAFEGPARTGVAVGCKSIWRKYDGKYRFSDWPTFYKDCQEHFDKSMNHALFSDKFKRKAESINAHCNQFDASKHSPVLKISARSSGILSLEFFLDPEGKTCTVEVTAKIELYVNYANRDSVYLTPQAVKATGTVDFTRIGINGGDGGSIASSEKSGTIGRGTLSVNSTMQSGFRASTADDPPQSPSDGSGNDFRSSVSAV